MRLPLLAAAALIAVSAAGARAQEGAAGLAAHLSQTPHSMKLKQFDANWLRVSVKSSDAGATGTGDMISKLMQIGLMADGGKMKGEGAEAMLGLAMMGGLGGGQAQASFTQGRTIAIGSETFLVTYAVEQKGPNLLDMMMQAEQTGKEPDMAALLGGGKWTEDTVASLALVNVRSIGTLSGVRPFDLTKEIAEGGSGAPDLMQLMLLGMRQETERTADRATVATKKPAARTKVKPK
ncbi:MAG: hypothetical protein FJX72_14825 [Armatimonadetes bacterium]|nr:hypothetical protein [Armatimonadota bacterium]